MAIYMKFGSVKGAVTTEGFKDWIEVDSLQWGVGRGIGSAARGPESRESSEPSISEVTVTKRMCSASTGLLNDALAGELNTTVEIKFTTTTKGKVEEFLSYELTDTGVSGYSMSSGGDMPQESLSLNFTKVMMTFKGLDPSTKGNPKTVGYHLGEMHTV
ncbi:MAG TPA: type VI secretion system tube protein Hcp [Acetobacteraceae bacterium]|nr:type VI secretion system tube protein Hcp [Acetobacteraceae bacterium]